MSSLMINIQSLAFGGICRTYSNYSVEQLNQLYERQLTNPSNVLNNTIIFIIITLRVQQVVSIKMFFLFFLLDPAFPYASFFSSPRSSIPECTIWKSGLGAPKDIYSDKNGK